MKSIPTTCLFAGVLLTGLILTAGPTTASAKTHYYTNPRVFRQKTYWYSRQESNGHYTYQRLHFTKHSVYFAHKSSLAGNWRHSHIAAKHYIIQKRHSWYVLGYRNSDATLYIKPTWRTMNHKKQWTLSNFDVSNGHGGYQTQAPYTVWIYSSYLTHNAWYYTTNRGPF